MKMINEVFFEILNLYWLNIFSLNLSEIYVKKIN